MPIKILEPKVVSLIAAGEVVERPAAVVKELVENSLDAGSTQISVEVEGGGINLLRVTDNGSGIPPEELELAFNRFATSKIASAADLESILSLGFRGEALSSIAAVAEVEVVTCTAGASGSVLSISSGEITGKGSQGRSVGTTVTVKNLFRRVPARLKFLKTQSTENSHIANIVSRYALIYPEVRFSLSLEGRVTLRTPGSGQLIDSITQVYGLEVAQHMMAIKPQDWESGGDAALVKVTGTVGSPRVSRGNRNYINLFVNRRWINHRYLVWAVEEAYHGLLMVGKHPAAVINVSLSPEAVDVNVHPTKSEVKFRDERAVVSAVQRAVRHTLVEQAPVPRVEDVSGASGTASQAPPTPLIWTPAVKSSAPAASQPPSDASTPGATLPVLRVVGQLMASYILAEGENGLYIIDQHAAHERIRFEEIRLKRSRREIEVQSLLEPVPFELSPRQAAVMAEHIEQLSGFGFTIEPFGERTFLVRAVPAWLADGNWRDMITELLDGGGSEDWEERITASLACHGAVRAGQVLSPDEMREMIRQLEQVNLPNTCPHGRPTMIYLGANQLEREFGRS